MNRVEGLDRGQVKLFTLSTCIWCRKTKALLKEMDVGYEYIDLDTLEGARRDEALEELRRFNPRCSFPSLVVDGSRCIVGFKEEEIKEVLKP
jgi:glutaredoxin-like protein NrdH